MAEKSMLAFVNETIRALCKETGEALVSHTLTNDGEDFKTKRYGGVEISPIVILNSGIAKIVESLIDGDPVDEEKKEKELLKLLLLKRSGILLAKGLKEAEEDKVRAAKEEAKLAKKLASMSDDAKKLASDPEVKRRRRKKVEEGLDVVVSRDPKEDQTVMVPLDDRQNVVEKVEIPKVCVNEESPFDELDAMDKKPPITNLDDFLAQEKLKALNALNDEPTI